MEIREYIVVVESFHDGETQILTGWIEGVKGTVVQCRSLPEIFTELGIHLKILRELKQKQEKKNEGISQNPDSLQKKS